MDRRADLLRRLAEFREPPGPLLAELRSYPFDWPGPALMVLTEDHFRSVLARYLAGDLTALQLQDWAECLERRDDVAFNPAAAALLDELHFRLANPEINGAITPDLVASMLDELGSSGV